MKKRVALVMCVLAAVALALLLVRGRGPTVAVEAGPIERQVLARAIVEPAEGIAHVGGPPGVLREIRVRVGDVVGRDIVLAKVEVRTDKGLETRELLAPIPGAVIAIRGAVGDDVAPGAPLFDMAYLGKLEARIEVDADSAWVIRAGAPVVLRPLGGGAELARAAVDRVSPLMGPRSIGLSDARLRAEGRVETAFASLPKGVPLLVGQEMEAVLSSTPVDVPGRLPHRAVHIEDGRAAVRVAGELFDTTTYVRLGTSDENWVEVLDLPPGTVVRVR